MEKKEYIERGAILRKSEPMFDGQKYCTAVNTGFIYIAPAADVVEVVHGEWILEREPNGKPYCFHCSACDGDFHYIGITVKYDYCPNCGAKMDGRTYTLAEVKKELGLDQMDGGRKEK